MKKLPGFFKLVEDKERGEKKRKRRLKMVRNKGRGVE